MSVVKINAIEVPAERADEMARRFAARAGEVEKAEGFEEFQLLRPTDERTTWLVYTRWRDEESFEAWLASRAFVHGHTQHTGGAPGGQPAGGQPGSPPQGGPVATGSALWSFRLEQRESSEG